MASVCTLLLVEDDEEFAAILQRRFQRRQMKTLVCHSPQDALAAIQAREFQLALIDGNLAGRDGVQLAGRVKELAPQLPILMLSGTTDEATVARALAAGVAQYLPKPCSLAEIEAAITRTLSDAATVAR